MLDVGVMADNEIPCRISGKYGEYLKNIGCHRGW